MTENKTETINFGINIIEQEIQALQNLIPLIDDEFQKAVECILQISNEGRLVVSGIGKPGFIGMKISATLASVGIPSYFLHPAEALHGDLGRYSRSDIALMLSNSGATDELLQTLPQIKRMGCPIISITGNRSSNLARQSDIILCIGQIKEADPLGLAPTSTTTAMLAMGDALAMAVHQQKGTTAEQFRQFHPGGRLGRSLMQVTELMRKGEYHCIVAEEEITKDVINTYGKTKGRPGATSIVDRHGILAGIFTDGDLRKHLAADLSFLERPIKEVMSTSPKTIKAFKLIEEALHTLQHYQIDQIIVVDEENRPVGMLDIQDIIGL